MRIGFDVTPLCVPQSGIGTYTLNLLDHLGRHLGDEIVPLAHRPWQSGPDRPDGYSQHLRVNRTVWMQAVLPWHLGRLGLDVCHFTNNVSSIWTPCPAVVTIHDMSLWLFPEYHRRRGLVATRPFIPLAARRAAAIITVSESAKRDIVRILGVPERRVHVIYEAPAPVFRLLPPGPELELVRKELELPPRFMLYVGTIEPRKNLVRLIEAFAQLRQGGECSYSLILVGQRGWKDEAVFKAVERLDLADAVRFLGYAPIETLVALYNLADALVFPSMYEGFGLPVVEAMVCGTPVITSASGSLAEVVGDAAEFVEPTDVGSIAAGIQRTMADSNRRAELRAKGLDRVTRFSWTEVAVQTRQLYAAVSGR
jgi:glycosyltransferase involved in cell wall biosynthesis